MQIVSFVPISNSSLWTGCVIIQQACALGEDVRGWEHAQIFRHPFRGCWGNTDPLLWQVHKEIIQLSGISLRSRNIVRKMFHLCDLGVWSQHKWHLTNTKCSPGFCPHTEKQENITQALLLTQSHFSLSSSTQTFMQRNKSWFIFWTISLILLQDFSSVLTISSQEKEGAGKQRPLLWSGCSCSSLLLFENKACNFTHFPPRIKVGKNPTRSHHCQKSRRK